MSSHAEPSQNLRRCAEEMIKTDPTIPEPARSLEEANALLHELRVHQIELELQNDELVWAQLRLESETARYSELYDLAPMGYCTFSECGLVMDANLTAATMLRIDRRALISQPISQFILPADQDIFYLHQRKFREVCEPQSCELRVLRKDGSVFWGHLTSHVTMGVGGEPVTRAVLSDISPYKQTEQDLHLANERLQLALKAAKAGIWEWRLDSGECTWSHELWGLFGLAPHSCRPSLDSWARTVHADDRHSVTSKVRAVLNDGSELNIEWRVNDSGNAERRLMFCGQAECEADGLVIGYLGVVIDITDRERIETGSPAP